ncbi:MAG: DUF763 domain-containing protein [Candidatus Micrarchaeaceae archaeon]
MYYLQNISVLPLHGGRAPKWLFPRMVKLASLIANEIIEEYGEAEMLSRISNPRWFQALACAIGYDWHSSGTTTVTMGALKEALNQNTGIYIAGGKGRQGLDTPSQIEKGADLLSIGHKAEELKYFSRMLAKIDSAMVYDEIGIYHHTIAFSKDGDWAIVQQAMHSKSGNAIRFQASSSKIDSSDPTNEANTSVSSNLSNMTIDLTYSANSQVKEASIEAINYDIKSVLRFAGRPYMLPSRHEIIKTDITKNGMAVLEGLSGQGLRKYPELLLQKGIGRKTLRSLALISSLIYEKEVAERDPIMYAYNVGGKDGIPYPINLKEYDSVIEEMKGIVSNISIDSAEKRKVLMSLGRYTSSLFNSARG